MNYQTPLSCKPIMQCLKGRTDGTTYLSVLSAVKLQISVGWLNFVKSFYGDRNTKFELLHMCICIYLVVANPRQQQNSSFESVKLWIEIISTSPLPLLLNSPDCCALLLSWYQDQKFELWLMGKYNAMVCKYWKNTIDYYLIPSKVIFLAYDIFNNYW